MKEYRSAIRSRNMIKRAFIELLDEKAISDISVVDIVNRADISRNTFYAHYDDVFCVLEELENDFIGKLRIYIGEGKDNVDEYTPLPLFSLLSGIYSCCGQEDFQRRNPRIPACTAPSGNRNPSKAPAAPVHIP